MDELSTQLRDIHAPEAVSWWPLAPGWWLVVACVVIAGVVLVPRLLNAWRRNAFRRAIRAELEMLRRDAEGVTETIGYLQDVNRLLRRVLLSLEPRQRVAALHGPAWIELLESHSRTALTPEVRAALAEDCYRGSSSVTIEAVHAAVRRWLDGLRLPNLARRAGNV